MGRRRPHNDSVNSFAQRKRIRKEGKMIQKPDRRSEPYQEIIKENEAFFKYYKHQNICPESEWDDFLKTIRKDLPTTFRLNSCRGETERLLEIIKTDFENYYRKVEEEMKEQSLTGGDNENNDTNFVKPHTLSWYPDGLAWQLQYTRKDIRRSESFYKIHNFLIAETNAGSISRQEAVSMIPPIVLDVKPHHKILDMCAAPGSKTAQIIEGLHADTENPSGFVIANDIDNKRCYMLVHQSKRLNSSCCIVTNHDSSLMPNFFMTNRQTGTKEIVKFDRILCDVPCSGDGTLRKNPDIWLKWNHGHANNLHGIQFRILKRACELLTIGGRVVYSTCSFNPIENEAVVHRLLKEYDDAMEIIDASDLVKGLKYSPGLKYWEPASNNIEFFTKMSDVPEKYHTIIQSQMFPPSADDADRFNLDKCMRILPHFQNTGGFFVAVLEKRKPLSASDAIRLQAVHDNETTEIKDADERSVVKSNKKERKIYGYREDPFVFFGKDDNNIWNSIKEFYDIGDKFNSLCLFTRSASNKKKNIYYCSEQVRDLILLNEKSIKIINTGVKTFVRCDNRNMSWSYRLTNEGLVNINYLIGNVRRVDIEKDDLIILLNNTEPNKPPFLDTLSKSTQERVRNMNGGCCILRCIDDVLSISLVGWCGVHSLRAYTDTNDTVHVLRLLGADLSKYDTNKFQKEKEMNSPESTNVTNECNSEAIEITGENNEIESDEKTGDNLSNDI